MHGPRRGFEELAHAAAIGIGRAAERSRQEQASCTTLIVRARMRRVTGLRAPVESVNRRVRGCPVSAKLAR
jgi:hypothetical protein